MKDDKRFQAVSTFFVILFLIGNHLCILPRRHFTFIHVPHVSWLSGSSVPYRVYCNAFLYLFEFIRKMFKTRYISAYSFFYQLLYTISYTMFIKSLSIIYYATRNLMPIHFWMKHDWISEAIDVFTKKRNSFMKT